VTALSDEASFRLRLEGGAELLETALLRHRALLSMAMGFRWRSKLRENTDLLRQTAEVQDEVDAMLEHAERRSTQEHWPPTLALVRTVNELRRLSDALHAVAHKRLGAEAEPLSLADRLKALELKVLGERRVVLPGQRWSAALEVLPASLPELQRVARFGAELEGLFKRPPAPRGRLPFGAKEFDSLEEHWTAGDEALVAVWTRVARIDAAGTLTRFLRKRSRRAPTRPPVKGPELLLHAEFWRDLAVRSLLESARQRVSPLEPRDAELFPLTQWMLKRDEDPSVRLEHPAFSDSLAGVYELAFELSQGSPRKAPGEVWDRLLARAERAQPALSAGLSEALALRDNLQLFVRVLQRSDAPSRPMQSPATLEVKTLPELIRTLRQRLSS
jgi:hypothetical protein